jgi:hypothetical protein
MSSVESFNGLMYYIGSQYNIHDSLSKEVATLCVSEGLTTWQQWVQLDCMEQDLIVQEVLHSHQN